MSPGEVLLDPAKRALSRACWRAVQPGESIASVRARHPEFDDRREEIRALGTDNLSVLGEDYRLEGGLGLQQRSNEFAALCLYLEDCGPGGTYLEIGTASAGTCRVLQERLGFEQLLSLDDGRHPRAGEQEANFAAIAGSADIHRYVGDSHSPAADEFIATHLAGPIGLAFIDGDHSYEGVLADTMLVLRHATPGTLLVYHDTVACEGVRNHWLAGALSGLFRPVASFVDVGPGALGIGVARVPDGSRAVTAIRNVAQPR
ncbi:MAG TPA: class I SAM-dependent methyltransferase [Solirubrobacteraceae bacterium]|nr:class I SAM-dependent methyltransferase [Solirubrobacteraceae bacterium]